MENGMLIISSKDISKNESLQSTLVSIFKGIPGLEIIGYGKALIEQIASLYRHAILLRSTSPAPLIKACHIAAQHGATPDIDPFSFS